MQTRYELSLKAEQPVVVENPKVMDYEKRINDLLKAFTQVLLESNRDLGERLADSRKQLESCLSALEKSEEEKKSLQGEIEQLKHARCSMCTSLIINSISL